MPLSLFSFILIDILLNFCYYMNKDNSNTAPMTENTQPQAENNTAANDSAPPAINVDTNNKNAPNTTDNSSKSVDPNIQRGRMLSQLRGTRPIRHSVRRRPTENVKMMPNPIQAAFQKRGPRN